MKYYVEINGESSLNIQGLAIQSLPSISKPLMRSKRTEIDGRDGDIITKLGYSAYDKTLKIGLWGNYDINQVIAFFNQEGTITFSNEPDKYYNFTILNREDYINQLEAFREASITIHCQPYKYELNEQPVELENEYVEQEGTSLTFNNTLVAPMEIDLKGNTLQNGTPTPSSPIPINNVSGDNDIVVCGKNLFDDSTIINGVVTNNSIGTSTTRICNNTFIKVQPNTTYTLSFNTTNGINNINISSFTTNAFPRASQTGWVSNFTFTTDSTTNYVLITFRNSNDIDISPNDISNVMLELSSTATTYEAYNCTTYNIDLIGKNKFNKNNIEAGYLSNAGNVISNANFSTSNFINVKGVSKITISGSSGSNENVCFYTNTKTFSSYVATGTNTAMTIDVPNNAYYIRATIKNTNLDAYQIEYGSEATTYEDYVSIELNKIGTYQDRPFKAVNGDKFYDSLDNATKQTLTYDKWYLHKEIGKYTFTGNENFTWDSDKQRIIIQISNLGINTPPLTTSQLFNIYNQKVIGTTFDNLYNKVVDNCIALSTGNSISIRSTGFDSLNTGKNTIANTDLHYILATPTNTEITYTPLIEQLESIKNAMSKEGTTNINQVNNDLPFIITASVLSGDNSVVVNNKGNIYSKPIMTIYGSGNIGVYLSDSQIFSINLGDEEYITLDTANMEAYKVGVLKNRLVSGDYNSFKLETGNNTISFTGNVKKVEIQNYSRWI